MRLSDREAAIIGSLIKRRRQIGQNGNYTDRFSNIIGRRLIDKMDAAGWIEQTGWFLSGNACYRLTDFGSRAAKSILKGRKSK